MEKVVCLQTPDKIRCATEAEMAYRISNSPFPEQTPYLCESCHGYHAKSKSNKQSNSFLGRAKFIVSRAIDEELVEEKHVFMVQQIQHHGKPSAPGHRLKCINAAKKRFPDGYAKGSAHKVMGDIYKCEVSKLGYIVIYGGKVQRSEAWLRSHVAS